MNQPDNRLSWINTPAPPTSGHITITPETVVLGTNTDDTTTEKE